MEIDKKVLVNITEKAPYFYILVDYGDQGPYLLMKVEKDTNNFCAVREFEDLSSFTHTQASELLDEGNKFFKEARTAIDYYLNKLSK
jgi:hypothetical protein